MLFLHKILIFMYISGRSRSNVTGRIDSGMNNEHTHFRPSELKTNMNELRLRWTCAG